VDLSTRESDGHDVVVLRGELDMTAAAGLAASLTAVAAGEPRVIVDAAAGSTGRIPHAAVPAARPTVLAAVRDPGPVPRAAR